MTSETLAQVVALRAALHDDLIAFGVPRNVVSDALIARLYGSFLASGLARKEVVDAYGEMYQSVGV